MLHPDIQIFMKTFNINQNVEQIKQYFAKRLKIPLDVLQIRLLGLYQYEGVLCFFMYINIDRTPNMVAVFREAIICLLNNNRNPCVHKVHP